MIDLHLHTTISDGFDAPANLVRGCAAAGITTLAVTDHDTTGAWADAGAAADALGLEFVPGIEITAVLDGRDVHMLGYFPTRRVPVLDEFLREQRADRVRRVRAMAERLAALGVPVSIDRALAATAENPDWTIGRPKIALAMIEAGYVADIGEAFDRYLGEGRPAFVPRSGATPAEVVELIASAGGIPSLAHPGLLERDEIIPSLILAGLPAVEVFHSDHDAETTARYLRMIERSGLLATGGSDYHGGGSGHHGALGRVVLPQDHYDKFRERLLA